MLTDTVRCGVRLWERHGVILSECLGTRGGIEEYWVKVCAPSGRVSES
jgi:hypothetical protein